MQMMRKSKRGDLRAVHFLFFWQIVGEMKMSIKNKSSRVLFQATLLVVGCSFGNGLFAQNTPPALTVHQFVVRESLLDDFSSRAINSFKRYLDGLDYQSIVKLGAEFMKNDRTRTQPFPEYVPAGSNAPKTVPIQDVHFMQRSIHDLSHDQKYDIITTARRLQKRQLDIMALPTIHVWKDSENKIWTINHRRLAAFILAGNMKVVPVVWASQKEVENNRFEYTTRTGGKSILAILTNRLALKVEAQ